MKLLEGGRGEGGCFQENRKIFKKFRTSEKFWELSKTFKNIPIGFETLWKFQAIFKNITNFQDFRNILVSLGNFKEFEGIPEKNRETFKKGNFLEKVQGASERFRILSRSLKIFREQQNYQKFIELSEVKGNLEKFSVDPTMVGMFRKLLNASDKYIKQ